MDGRPTIFMYTVFANEQRISQDNALKSRCQADQID